MPPSPPRQWRDPNPDPQAVEVLCRALGVHRVTAEILVARNLRDPDEAEMFLYPDFDLMENPMKMAGMKRAVHRTLLALRDGDPIRVFGDYDVDGVTAASCVYLFLQRLGVRVDYRIPLRDAEGYGLTVHTVELAASEGVKLLITTDCGISNVAEIERANALGLDVIVIDHHALPPELPPARAILNPLQPECEYPFKRFAAVGLAFMFVYAVTMALERYGALPEGHPDLREYLDLVALGTVADVMPLLGENRILVRKGLEVLRRRRRPGINALLERAQVDGQPINARTIGYRLAPLINAAGRMGDASRCVRLLTTEAYGEADRLSRELEQDNLRRQAQERAILEEAVTMAEQQIEAGHSILFLHAPHWHPGVLGIIASRIKERFHRPAALLSINPNTGVARVSIRSIEGIDLIQALQTVEPLLLSFGGHVAAAGMTFDVANLQRVQEGLNLAILTQVGQLPSPSLPIDADCSLEDLSGPLPQELLRLAPFGAGNPEPVLRLRNVRAFKSRVVHSRHLRTRIRDGESYHDAIGFTLAPLLPLLNYPVDIAFTPRITQHRGRTRVELLMRDIQPHGEIPEELLHLTAATPLAAGLEDEDDEAAASQDDDT